MAPPIGFAKGPTIGRTGGVIAAPTRAPATAEAIVVPPSMAPIAVPYPISRAFSLRVVSVGDERSSIEGPWAAGSAPLTIWSIVSASSIGDERSSRVRAGRVVSTITLFSLR